MGDWQSAREHGFLMHFSDGGSGMREYDRLLKVGDEFMVGGQPYRVERVEEKTTRGGFHHAWVVLRE